MIILNSTDMSLGAQFSFIQEHFDRLCSDLDGVQVSRAVLSSSALPGAFTPLTFENYNKSKASCGYAAPTWVNTSLGLDETGKVDPNNPGNLDANPPRFDRARTWKSYEDGASRPFIHLVDGGVSDNIGLRGPMTSIAFGEGRTWSILSDVANKKVDRLVFVVVNARPRKEPKRDQRASPPNILSVLSAAASRPMANYSTETLQQLLTQVDEWRKDSISFNGQRGLCDQAAARRCESSQVPNCLAQEKDQCYEDQRLTEAYRQPTPKLHTVHVRFDAIRDEKNRRRLQRLPTSLQLPPEDVQLLIDAAATLLSESKPFADLLMDLRSDG